MLTTNIHDAKTHFSALLARVERDGEHVVVCRNGKPVADLVPHRPPRRTVPHPVMSKLTLHYDPCEDLSDDEWPEESR